MEWQPIETCPDDCGLVLVTDGGHVTPAIRYNGDWRFWDGETVDDWRGDVAGALNWWVDGFGPKLWAPLPKAPA